MKRFLIALCIGVLISGNVFAYNFSDTRVNIVDNGGRAIIDLLGSDSIVIAGVGDIQYSSAFQLRQGWVKALWVQVTSVAGTTAVKVEYVVSYDGITYVTPDNIDDLISSLSDEILHAKAFAPTVSPFYKIKFTGLAGSPVDMTVAILKYSHAAEY